MAAVPDSDSSGQSALSERASRAAGLALVVAAHASALGWLWHSSPVRDDLRELATVMVSFVQPEVRQPPKPEPPTPKPRVEPVKPKAVRAPEPPPVLAVPQEVPAPELPTVEHPVVKAPEPVLPVESPVNKAPESMPAMASLPAPPAPVTPPRFNADYLTNPAPEYPRLSRRLGEEGRVLLRVFVTAEGLPSKVEVKTSSGFPRLDESAVQTVWHWKFVPARQADQPVAAWVLIPINFSLRS